MAVGAALGMVGRQGEASFGAATSVGLVLGLTLGSTDLGTTLRLLLASQAPRDCGSTWGWLGCGPPQAPLLAQLTSMGLWDRLAGEGGPIGPSCSQPHGAWHSAIHSVPLNHNVTEFLANNTPKGLIISDGYNQLAPSS